VGRFYETQCNMGQRQRFGTKMTCCGLGTKGQGVVSSEVTPGNARSIKMNF